MIAIADTGFVVAVSISTDKRHEDCLQVYQQHRKILLLEASLAEIAFMLRRYGGNRALVHFLRGLASAKRYEIVHLVPEDHIRISQILEKYADIDLDFVDAAITAIAERLNVTRILTLDQRDFQILRPAHADHFELLP
jgi:uncharacterized protein